MRKNRKVKVKAAPGTPGFFSKLFRWMIWMSFLIMICTGVITYGAYFFYRQMSEDLPRISSLKDYHPPVITTVYSDDNRKIAEFYTERRILRPFSDMPKMLINAFVSSEDSRFFTHQGVDIFSIVRAFFKNVEAGTIVQGGSTITQQVTKSFLLTPERSYDRKIKEAILAYRIDKAFTKEEILYLYLNQIYLGHGAYGVEAAAENYFGKSVKDLNLAECSMMAGLPQAPSKYSPFNHPEKAKERQGYVLKRMVTEGYITEAQANEALKAELDIKPRKNWYIEQVPYYTEYVRQYIEKKYGHEALYNEGLQIYTAVNIEMQKIAGKSVEKGLREHGKRHGYRGAIRHIEPEKIEAYSKSLQRELDTEHETTGMELHKGTVVKGVITHVNKNPSALTVSIGKERGIIEKKDMRWAGNAKNALNAGDVILVKIKDKIKHVGSSQRLEPTAGLEPEDSEENETSDSEEDDELPESSEPEEITEPEAENPDDSEPANLSDPESDGITWRLALEQSPEAQSALLCIELETSQVKAMIGGRDFKESQFNRAVQSKRQPGSAFKPIIYAAALDKGYTPATEIIDNAVVMRGSSRSDFWRPRNYDRRFYGPTMLRTALAKSRNLATIKILDDIGIGYAVKYAKKLGITSNLGHNPSLALGTSGVSLLELVNAYSVFAKLGEYSEPIFITKILNRNGKVIEELKPEPKEVIEKNTAYIMTNLLESVIKNGTAKKVLALNRPAVAGKTGTTNDLRDAWFIGYTPDYITGVWMGFDIERSLGKGETGAKAAIPIWLDFMKQIVADKPVRHFKIPSGVVFSRIDAETGLLAVPGTRRVISECFKSGTAPTRYSRRPDTIADAEQFFKSDM